MDPSTDVELQELFEEEVTERARRLVEGAEAMAGGSKDGWDLASLARDAHTIKGSCRVMGYPVMARAAEILEETWKRLQKGGTPPDSDLGVRLREVALRLTPAVAASPEGGTPELVEAIEALESFQPTIPAAVRPVPAAVTGSEGADPVQRTEPIDLGGLLADIEEGVGEATITVEAGRLYRLLNRLAELRVEARSLAETMSDLRVESDHPAALFERFRQGLEGLQRTAEDLQEQGVALAGVPLREIAETFPRLARYVAGQLGKEVRVQVVGDDAEVDRQVAERIADPLRHLLVNAIDHGIESPDERTEAGKSRTGTVALGVEVSEGRLRITVEDDGRGVDWVAVERVAGSYGLITGEANRDQLVRALFAEGLSTSSDRTEFSGDGTGLALLAEAVDALGGSVEFESPEGGGTRVDLTLPAWRALQEAVLVRVGDHLWGVPKAAVVAILSSSEAHLVSQDERLCLLWGEQTLPAGSFAAAVGLLDEERPGAVLVLSTRGEMVGVTVPEILGSRQVAAKSLGPLLGGAPLVAGAAVLGGGEIVAMVDPNLLAERVRRLAPGPDHRPAVLVVDDSVGVRRLMIATLAGQGFEPVVARDAEEARKHLRERRFDALVVDYSMPGSDGVELATSVRETAPDLPIVMVSAVATEDDQARASEAGVDAYFDKSDLREGGLAATLHSLIQARRSKLEVGS